MARRLAAYSALSAHGALFHARSATANRRGKIMLSNWSPVRISSLHTVPSIPKEKYLGLKDDKSHSFLLKKLIMLQFDLTAKIETIFFFYKAIKVIESDIQKHN